MEGDVALRFDETTLNIMAEDVCKVEIIQRGARKKTMEKCHLFLFNDILLICTNRFYHFPQLWNIDSSYVTNHSIRLHFLRDEKRYTCKSTFHINQVEVRGNSPCCLPWEQQSHVHQGFPVKSVWSWSPKSKTFMLSFLQEVIVLAGSGWLLWPTPPAP